MIKTFKILHGLDKGDSSLFFTLDKVVCRGHSLKLFKKRARLDLRKHSFGYRVVDGWNSLDDVTVRLFGSFKTCLHKYVTCWESGVSNIWTLTFSHYSHLIYRMAFSKFTK